MLSRKQRFMLMSSASGLTFWGIVGTLGPLAAAGSIIGVLPHFLKVVVLLMLQYRCSCMDVKGIMIAAPSSGTGKTTVSIGIMRALSDMGFKVQPFKVGPDYIDPGFHWLASANKSYNIDTVMGNSRTAREIYFHNSAGKDISVVEGVMGLFDGKAGNTIKGSSFDISLILGIPLMDIDLDRYI